MTATSRPGGPIEPSADLRRMARSLREVYIALVNEGFTPDEALKVISTVISSQAGGGK